VYVKNVTKQGDDFIWSVTLSCDYFGLLLWKGFPTVPLTDMYAVIAYYLAHHDEVDDYLKYREEV